MFKAMGKIHPRFQTPFMGTLLAGAFTGTYPDSAKFFNPFPQQTFCRPRCHVVHFRAVAAVHDDVDRNAVGLLDGGRLRVAVAVREA